MVHHDAAGGILLVVAAALAIVVANSPLAGVYEQFLGVPVRIVIGSFSIDKPLLLWINDGLMALFFFLIGLEVKRELVEGHLSSRDQIILPAIGAAAGVITPAIIYSLINSGDLIAERGWAVPAATDIAFALGVLSLFGRRVPASLKLFLLSVAIFDDIAAIIIIALFYFAEVSMLSLTVAVTGLAILFVLNRMGVRYQSVYVLIGIVVWASVLKSGVHATLAGFAVALLVPLKARNEHGQPILKAMEHGLQPWVAFFILPVFAFSNAGVNLAGTTVNDFLNPISLGIALGLFLGNQLGIFTVCWTAVKLGISKLPMGATWPQLYGVASLCGIGFTMSLFIGSLAFEGLSESYLHSVKIGVLSGSILSVLFGSYIIYKATQENLKNTRFKLANS
ncbi:Na+/H+ antiporter NhaA [Microbulbifer spongiae]|uniref:Na(+)/H(+) antiporter NhaA n=1 Tax=Microbulbifer spongiae TaxID=2944933 RepID=A0ABY9EF59_9GAMM|nr:Na+/H+ antiporter NhaA [Microbulbifer sp. MI-G]WKD51609.1 Na+/H+ antiporter NhaA [Microbulbifer sp. MI-G]